MHKLEVVGALLRHIDRELAFAARAQFVNSNNAEKEIERTKTRSKANLL